MKKIGILTFHKSINYGSVLQTWALTHILKKNKYEVEIIDYEPKVYKKMYSVFRKDISLKVFIFNLKRVPLYTVLKRQIDNFENFRSENLPIGSIKYYYDTPTNTLQNFYDCIITGSDQIWNIHAQDCDLIYFLPFKTSGRKIAYACSINNTDFSEENCGEKLKKLILDYDFISIREDSGNVKVKKFVDCKKEIYTTLDPTLLNTKEVYESIASNRIIRNDYIFLYNVWSREAGIEAAKKVSTRLGLPVYTALTKGDIKSIYRIEKNGIKVEKKLTSPSDFLSLIKFADFVVTDSFHGTAFSLIYEKEFVCVNAVRKDGLLKNDERLINILNLVGLDDRYITACQIDQFDFNKKVNYEQVTRKRMEEAQKSIDLLIGAIEGKIKS